MFLSDAAERGRGATFDNALFEIRDPEKEPGTIAHVASPGYALPLVAGSAYLFVSVMLRMVGTML